MAVLHAVHDSLPRPAFPAFREESDFELSAESGGTLFYRGALFAAREMNVVKARLETVRFVRSGSPFAEAAGLRMIGRPAD